MGSIPSLKPENRPSPKESNRFGKSLYTANNQGPLDHCSIVRTQLHVKCSQHLKTGRLLPWTCPTLYRPTALHREPDFHGETSLVEDGGGCQPCSLMFSKWFFRINMGWKKRLWGVHASPKKTHNSGRSTIFLGLLAWCLEKGPNSKHILPNGGVMTNDDLPK